MLQSADDMLHTKVGNQKTHIYKNQAHALAHEQFQCTSELMD